ncbi:MAG: HAD hydrolase-like protein [Myxococcota bacterium]
MVAPRMAPSALFFDLDGTLTDPKPGITGCIQYALERLGEPVPSKDDLEWCIGPPLQENFTALVGSERAARGVALYRERFGDVGLFENEVYDGIPDVLASFAAADTPLFVASSKPKVYVDRILDHFELTSFFQRVYGSELDGTNTDKRDLLAVALADSGVRPSEATMIGDRAQDAIGAGHNAMDFVGALYGYGSREELEDEGTTRFVHAPRELVPALAMP